MKLNKEKCIADIRELMPLGKTFGDIAKIHGVTQQRVHQVFKEMGWTPGFEIGLSARIKRREALKWAEQFCRFGMPRDEMLKVLKECKERGLPSPSIRYGEHRRNALARGVEWGFTFGTWWGVWKDHYQNRGRGGSLLEMCRKGDVGPYSPENVYIAQHKKNVDDYWADKRGASNSIRKKTKLR